MIRAAISSCLIFFISLAVSAEPAINCSAKESAAAIYHRDISHAQYGENVDIKTLLRETLIEHANRIERMARWAPKNSGPNSEYIQVLIDLLDERAGMNQEFSCFWPLHQSGDTVRKFSDNDPMVYRDGYALFRHGVLIAYFYSAIGVV